MFASFASCLCGGCSEPLHPLVFPRLRHISGHSIPVITFMCLWAEVYAKIKFRFLWKLFLSVFIRLLSAAYLTTILVWWKSCPYLRLIIHLAALAFLIVGYNWVISTHFIDNHLLKKRVSGCIWVVVGNDMSKDHRLSDVVYCCMWCMITTHGGNHV